MTPEGRVKAAIKKWLDERGYWRAGAKEPAAVHGWYYMPQNIGMGVSGIPDFMGGKFLQGRALPWGIEAKAPGEGPTPTQLDRHKEMRAAGWLVLVVDDVNQLAALEAYRG
jgi:hypothetical protein